MGSQSLKVKISKIGSLGLEKNLMGLLFAHCYWLLQSNELTNFLGQFKKDFSKTHLA